MPLSSFPKLRYLLSAIVPQIGVCLNSEVPRGEPMGPIARSDPGRRVSKDMKSKTEDDQNEQQLNPKKLIQLPQSGRAPTVKASSRKSVDRLAAVLAGT